MRYNNQEHRVIIEVSSITKQLNQLLDQLNEPDDPERREQQQIYRIYGFMEMIVEACRYRDRAVAEFEGMLTYGVRRYLHVPNHGTVLELVGILRQLAYHILQQLVAMKLYDENGLLMYRIDRPYIRSGLVHGFKELVLIYIQRLTWNQEFYDLSPR